MNGIHEVTGSIPVWSITLCGGASHLPRHPYELARETCLCGKTVRHVSLRSLGRASLRSRADEVYAEGLRPCRATPTSSLVRRAARALALVL